MFHDVIFIISHVSLLFLNNYLFLQSTELHIYTDFLRIVLEIINAILTYALPRNPEVCIGLQFSLLDRTSTASNIFLQVVYAVLHRQEVFEPRFNELLENIYTVCVTCRSWRGEGMKAVVSSSFRKDNDLIDNDLIIFNKVYNSSKMLTYASLLTSRTAPRATPASTQIDVQPGVAGGTQPRRNRSMGTTSGTILHPSCT